MGLNANFQNDLQNIYLQGLSDMGWTPEPDAELEKLGVMFYDLKRRYITAKPRKVFRSDQLDKQTAHHPVLKVIENKARNGEELTPNLSKAILKPNSIDHMMADWGIHHLHLSMDVERKGFVKRTRDVLFARVEQDEIYFIDILPHGHGHLPWVDLGLLEIVWRNWPHLVERWRVVGASGQPLTPKKRYELRQHGVLVPAVLSDGTVLLPSGGITTYCTSGEALEDTDRDILMAEHAQASLPKIQKLLHGQGASDAELKFRLLEIRPRLMILEESSGERFILQCSEQD